MVNATPVVWVLCGPKAGDNSQMMALAQSLEQDFGYSVVYKKLAFRGFELLLHVVPRPTLAGLRAAARASLNAPWPDLVLTAGRRNELVARWIQRQSPGTRLVHLGRPWSRPDRFDLVVSTPQYTLEASSTLLLNTLPLHRVDEAGLIQAGKTWRPVLSKLRRPYLVLLVGGDSGPYVFDDALARELATSVNSALRQTGGSLLLSTSARTPEPFLASLLRYLVSPGHQYHWHDATAENPYLGYLALGDCFIVTAESISMLTEAAATGKPVWLFDIPTARDSHWWLTPSSYRWKPLTHRLTMAIAPQRFRRDIHRIHSKLVELKQAQWLSDVVTKGSVPLGPPLADELKQTTQRVAALLHGNQAGGSAGSARQL